MPESSRKRTIRFDEDFFMPTLIRLKTEGRESHARRILQRCLGLQIEAEHQSEVLLLAKGKVHNVYELTINGDELYGFEPYEGYHVLFTLSEKVVFVLMILYYNNQPKISG